MPDSIVGLVGYAQSGKDTVADVLVRSFWYTRRAFADPLRQGLEALDPILPARAWPPRFWRARRYGEHLRRHGYEATKAHPEARRLLQRLGTEAGRDVLGAEVWVDAWLKRALPCRKVVATDVRFPNEVEAIRQLGGVVVLIDRPSARPVNGHASESLPATVTPDVTIRNDSTLEELLAAAYGLGVELERREHE